MDSCLTGILIRLVNAILMCWNPDDDVRGSNEFFTLCFALGQLLVHSETSPNDLQELISALFTSIQSAHSEGLLFFRRIHIYVSPYFKVICSADECRARQIFYVMSRHPHWPSIKQAMDDTCFSHTDVDGRETLVFPMNLPWVQHVIDPAYVPPREWNLNLPPEWASHPQHQGQEHESDLGVTSSGTHGDEGLIFVRDEEQDHPVTILPTGMLRRPLRQSYSEHRRIARSSSVANWAQQNLSFR